MPRAVRSFAAEEDLFGIARQIGVRDRRPQTASKIVDELIAKCETYAQTPLIGTLDDSLFDGCRIGRHKRWLIFYRPVAEGIEVVRILDGARDYPRLFK